jgi:ABC-2 type transport system permease protein
MVGRIARKELLETMRDGRFRVLAVMVLALSAVSFAAGWKQYVDVQRQHDEAQQASRGQWLNQPAKNPHSAAHYGMYAFKPKSRLSLVDTGIDPYVGVAAWLEAHKQNEFRYRPAQDRTAVQRFGELTAAEGFLVILPLFIVLASFTAFAGEREQGTLRQLLSLGVTRRDLAAGKALGVSAALALVIVPVTALGVIAMAFTSEFEGLRGDLPRAGLLALAYLLYFVAIVATSLGVSAWARSSRTALVVLLAFWFVNSLVVSRAAADLAAWLYPTPSAVEFQTAMEKDLANQDDVQSRLERRRQELMRQYNASSMDAVPINFSGISLQEGEEHGNEVFDRHYGQLFERYQSQNRALQWMGVAAPMLPARALSMALAGSDFSHHRDFVVAAEEYRRGIQRVMNADIARNAKPGVAYTAGSELWAQVPEFEYELPGSAWALREAAASIILLLAWCLGAAWFAVRATRRLVAE